MILEDIIWTTRDKSKIRLGDMTDMHLENAAKMLRRKAYNDNSAYWSVGSMLSGGGATYEWEMAQDREEEKFRLRIRLAEIMDVVRTRRNKDAASV